MTKSKTDNKSKRKEKPRFRKIENSSSDDDEFNVSLAKMEKK